MLDCPRELSLDSMAVCEPVAGYMPKSIHPVNADEKCPYLMLEEEIISIGGLTVDVVQHKSEKGDKKLYVFGFPDGRGGHWYEVKGLNHFDNYARNASLLIQAVKALKAKAGEISATRVKAVRETADTLKTSGLAPVAIQAALCAQYALKEADYLKIMAMSDEAIKVETAAATIA